MPRLNFKVVIPARYGSRRFPAKPLYPVLGQPLIRYSYDNAMRSGADEVIVASDDQRIIDCVNDFGGVACLTSQSHKSGSDRVAEVAALRQWKDEQIVVNLQADEPLIGAREIRTAADCLASRSDADVVSLATPVAATKLASDSIVSVVCDQRHFALYFSRAVLPVGSKMGLHHLGIYVYYCHFLKHFATLAQPQMERSESLEQLRVLWHGNTIYVKEVSLAAHAAVDHEADVLELEKILSFFQSNS